MGPVERGEPVVDDDSDSSGLLTSLRTVTILHVLPCHMSDRRQRSLILNLTDAVEFKDTSPIFPNRVLSLI